MPSPRRPEPAGVFGIAPDASVTLSDLGELVLGMEGFEQHRAAFLCVWGWGTGG